MSVLDHAMGHPMEVEENGSMPLMGGLMNHGYQCGMLWGATLAAGAYAYRLYGPDAPVETAAIMASQKITEAFRARNKNEINCLEITDLNWQEKGQTLKILKFFFKGGPIACVNMAVKYSREALKEIEAFFSEIQPGPADTAPVSCASVLAQKMGATDIQQVMAAGFAGGIGFSGSACGALGAAVWINGMNSSREGAGTKGIIARATDTVDKFIKNTDYTLECSEIVGRKFENIGDHTDYLRGGGCAKILEVLVATGMK